MLVLSPCEGWTRFCRRLMIPAFIRGCLMEQQPPLDAADESARWREYERRKQLEIERVPDPQELAAFCQALAEELRI